MTLVPVQKTLFPSLLPTMGLQICSESWGTKIAEPLQVSSVAIFSMDSPFAGFPFAHC